MHFIRRLCERHLEKVADLNVGNRLDLVYLLQKDIEEHFVKPTCFNRRHFPLGKPLKAQTMSTWGEWLGLTSSSTPAATNDSSAEGSKPGPDQVENLTDEQTLEMVKEALDSGLTRKDSHEHHYTYEGEEVDEESLKKSMFMQFASMIGMDVMNMSFNLPIFLFEPTTTTTRMAETFQFVELMNKAAAEKDPVMRHAYVAAFIISSYCHSIRLLMPFDSVPGETFALDLRDLKVRYLAEHIRDSPNPLTLGYGEGPGWSFTEDVQVQATFHGNSVAVSNKGHRKITFTDSGEVLSWTFPTSTAHNLFVGSSYIDHSGKLQIKSNQHAIEVDLDFVPCGWFESGRYEVKGAILDESRKSVLKLDGKWNSHMYACKPGDEDHPIVLWEAGDHYLDGSAWKFTKFGDAFHIPLAELQKHKNIPLSDARYRKDVQYLWDQNKKMAAEARNQMESKRKQIKKNIKGDPLAMTESKFFHKCKDLSTSFTEWDYSGKYWEVMDDESNQDPRKTQPLF
mmetsp:Transcript_6195/g.11197  ORF Transcript_6195/g.11197 Transcript_6195/m.11197 type:complete len:510 (+) Transcript_6195:866-2395(+)